MLGCQFRKKLNIECIEFQLILKVIAMEINLTITILTCNWKQELSTTETFRKTPTVIRHLLSSPRQPTTLWPKAPDFAV